MLTKLIRRFLLWFKRYYLKIILVSIATIFSTAIVLINYYFYHNNLAAQVIVNVTFLFVLIILMSFLLRYRLGRKPFVIRYFELYDSCEKAVVRYGIIKKIFSILVLLLILISSSYYVLTNASLRIGLVETVFLYAQELLATAILFLYLDIVPSFLVSKDFPFYFAKACIKVSERKFDLVEKANYLILGLNSYNKFLKRNLKLQFDDVGEICSKLISDPNIDKTEEIRKISLSFEDDDKLKPVQSLSKILGIQATEQFLVKEQLGQKIKEQSALMVPIITATIALIQSFIKLGR